MNPTLHTLRDWSEQGWLRRLDSAMADFVAQHDPQAEPALLVATALLTHMEGRGHVCLPLADLVRQPHSALAWPAQASEALGTFWPSLPPAPAAWVQALQRSPVVRCVAVTDGKAPPDTGQPLVLGGTPEAPLLYLRRYWVYEQQVAQAVGQRAAVAQAVDERAARDWLNLLFPKPSANDAASPPPVPDWQKIACALALRSRLTVITGGPGTGKTYTAARLLALLLATSPDPAQLRVALAAPTGKAAARLRQSIDQSLASLQASLQGAIDLHALAERIGKARTLHSLLGMHQGSRQFQHNAQHPLDVDVLIVDETSMVHLEMMAALLQAMPPQATLILLGDKDQLASVEAGSVLGDLCAHAQDTRYHPATCDYLRTVAGEALSASATPGSALDQQTVMLRHSRRFGTDIGALAKAVNAGAAFAIQTTPDVPWGAYDLLQRGTRQALAAGTWAPPAQVTQAPVATDLAAQKTAPQAKAKAPARARPAAAVQAPDAPAPAPEAPGSAAPAAGKVYLLPTPVLPEAVVQLALHGRALAPACYGDYLRAMHHGMKARPVPAAPATNAAPPDAASAAQTSAVDAHTAWVKTVLQAFDRFRILCAVHDGPWGDRAMNQQVQNALARTGLLQPQGEWFAGRPIMVTRNDKALGVFNGDVGVVLPAPEGKKNLRAYFLDGEQLRSVSVSRLAHVETAFAMTIHKSQGSEFFHTVVVLPDAGGDLLTRELVYTGITRAKEFLTLVEPRPGLLGTAMAQQVKRASGLSIK